MSSFENLRIVDNFYQTSLYYPMPTVVVSAQTIAEWELGIPPEPSTRELSNRRLMASVSSTAARPRIAVSIYAIATDCFCEKPISMSL